MFNNNKLSIKQMKDILESQFNRNSFDEELIDKLCVLLEKFTENCNMVFTDYIDRIPSHDLSIIIECMNQCANLRKLLDNK